MEDSGSYPSYSGFFTTFISESIHQVIKMDRYMRA
ncbi:hypothetical protein KSS87_013977 [Heliosperma pusillum]|nr:hypothetical protein KSS87_013977 [Heliosperma pusillum]